MSARGGFGLMKSIGLVYNAFKPLGIIQNWSRRYGRRVTSPELIRGDTGDSRLHCSNPLGGGWNLDSMEAGAAQDGSGDRVKLRRLALLHVFLHRTPHVSRHLENSGDERVHVDFGALGNSDRAGFAHAGQSGLPPFGI